MVAGLGISALIVGVVAQPRAHSLTWPGLFSRSAELLLLAAGSALAVVWAVCRIFREELGHPSVPLRAYAWSVAIWLPLMLLLWSEHAVWIVLAPVPITALLTRFGRKQMLAAEVAETDVLPVLSLREDLFAATMARNAVPVGVPAVLLALLLQACCAAFAAQQLGIAEALLIALAGGIVWCFTTVPPNQRLPLGGRLERRGRRALALPCFLLTCLALTPFLRLGLGSGKLNSVVMAGTVTVKPPRIVADTVFSTVVLLAPPLPKHKLVAPVSHGLTSGSFSPSRPLTIPFDGAYRYFTWRGQYSGALTRTQRGDPIKANVQSTDFSPLMMEAHQRLGDRLDAGCCRSIDLALTNGDNRYGRIDVEMLLKNITPGGTVTKSLGTVPVRSSLAQKISIYRAPVDETLHFPLKGDAKHFAFNEITLLVKLSEHRNLAGAKVRVREFQIVP
jgi:hypothetical protein